MKKLIKKPIIAIIGGIAAGKTTVAKEFAKLGGKVIDADEIAHQVLDLPDIKKKAHILFGPLIFDTNGKINRKKLAKIVFSDADKLNALNKLVHPEVLSRTADLIDHYNLDSSVKAIILDIPLLLEAGWDKQRDYIVFVDCPQSIRLERAKKCGLGTEAQIKNRENFQISVDNKKAIADNIIYNDSSLASLESQVTDIFSCVVKNK